MPNPKLNDTAPVAVQHHWFVLAFLAGAVNAGGFMACQRFVSHVTGFATLAGVELSEGSTDEAFSILTIPAFFLAGTIFAGFLIEREKDQRGRFGANAWTMLAISISLLLVTALGYFEVFGTFGAPASISHDYFLQALLCGAAGMMNASVTASSGGSVRVTHVTGLTTDMGLGIARAFRRYRRGERSAPSEFKVNALRALSIFLFILGSAVGAATFHRFQYLGFLLPFAIALYSTVLAFRTPRALPDAETPNAYPDERLPAVSSSHEAASKARGEDSVRKAL